MYIVTKRRTDEPEIRINLEGAFTDLTQAEAWRARVERQANAGSDDMFVTVEIYELTKVTTS